MTVSLSAIQQEQPTRDIVLDFEDAGTVNMTIDPDRYTIGWQRRIRAAIKDNDAAGLADAFFSVVLAWDLADDAGDTLPLTQEGIDHLRLETVTTIMRKMNEAVDAPKAETTTSSSTPSRRRTSTKST